MTDVRAVVSPPRRRMIDDMAIRNLSPATQLLCLAIKHSGVRWKQARGWTEVLAQLTILFADRLTKSAR